MKRAVLLFLWAWSVAVGATEYDQDKPFGFCTVASRTDASKTFECTGGGCYTYPVPEDFAGRVTVLTSDGPEKDMKAKIEESIKNCDVIILDGSKGDFIVSSNVECRASNRTIIGIHNARLSTRWKVTPKLRRELENIGIPHMSTSRGTGGLLPGGAKVGEQAEFYTRKFIIWQTGDTAEHFRKAGTMSLRRCQNVIIRNITFIGPGAIDVGGNDLLTFNEVRNSWVDHCTFIDGQDGNFDISSSSDYNTVSWCTFSYTERSFMHQNTNLVGYSDREKPGFLSTTFAFNWWGTGCRQRMPMGRMGKIHVLNNYYSSTNATNCINPRKDSEFLIEGNYIEKGVRKYYSQEHAKAVTWTADNNVGEGRSVPPSLGDTVSVPYSYSAAPSSEVPALVKDHAGATLYK